MLRNLTAHPEIAIAFDLPTSHRACQVKGHFVSTRPARPTERAEVERQVDSFLADMENIGIPRSMGAGFKIWPCTAIELRCAQFNRSTRPDLASGAHGTRNPNVLPFCKGASYLSGDARACEPARATMKP